MTKEHFVEKLGSMARAGAPLWAINLAEIVYYSAHPPKGPTEIGTGQFTIGSEPKSDLYATMVVERCPKCSNILRLYHPNAKDMSPTPACPNCKAEPIAKPEGCGKSLGGI